MLFLALVDDGNAVLQNSERDDVLRAYDVSGPSACMWSTSNMSELPMAARGLAYAGNRALSWFSLKLPSSVVSLQSFCVAAIPLTMLLMLPVLVPKPWMM